MLDGVGRGLRDRYLEVEGPLLVQSSISSHLADEIAYLRQLIEPSGERPRASDGPFLALSTWAGRAVTPAPGWFPEGRCVTPCRPVSPATSKMRQRFEETPVISISPLPFIRSARSYMAPIPALST